MSVALDYVLPNQPATGGLTFIPLGGNGIVAPMSAYVARVGSTGDATGGTHAIRIRGDEKYTQLCSFMACQVVNAAADVEMRVELRADEQEHYIALVTAATHDYGGGSSVANAAALWTPPAVLFSARPGDDGDPPFVRMMVPNVDGQDIFCQARVYNFDKRARELTPIEQLLATTTRASQITA